MTPVHVASIAALALAVGAVAGWFGVRYMRDRETRVAFERIEANFASQPEATRTAVHRALLAEAQNLGIAPEGMA